MMDELNETLQQLAEATSAVERQVQELKDAAGAYTDEAAHGRRTGNPVASFGGSAAQKTLDAVSIKLKTASQQVQFVGTELVRFS